MIRIPETWLERLSLVLLSLIVLAGLYYSASVVAPVLSPVILSLLFAYFLQPLIDWLEARRIRRWLAIVTVGTLLLGGALGLAAVFVAAVVPEVIAALPRLQAYMTEILADPDAWMASHPDHPVAQLVRRFAPEADLSAELQAGLSALVDNASAALTGTLDVLATSLQESVGTALNVLLIPIFTFYFLMDFHGVVGWPLVLVPERWKEPVRERASRMDRIVGQWVRGQIQVGVILGILYAIGLTLAGVRLGWVIGMLAGLLNVVPFLGVFFGLVLSLIMALMSDHVLWQLGGVAIVFIIVQLLEGNLITPRLVGGAVGMSPLFVMVVLLLGGSLFGFFGLVFCIPAVAAGTVLAKDLLDIYRDSPFYRGQTSPEPPESPPSPAT